MRVKYLAAMLLCVCVCVLLSSCEYINFNTVDLMEPPKPTGEMYDIRQALDKGVSGSYQLKYPTSGEYRSAFTVADLDGDGKSEALSFYLTGKTTQNPQLHIGLIVQSGHEWKLSSDVAVAAADIESLRFADLDGDGLSEVLVGWNIYTAVEKRVEVYKIQNGTLLTRISEPYTNYITCDLNGSGKNDILVLYHNTAEMTSLARLLELTESGVKELGNTAMDGGVTGYLDPVVTTLENGDPAVFIDANKGDGLITEVLCYNDGLYNPGFDAERNENAVTQRGSLITLSDINGDGRPEIPVLIACPGYETRPASERVYITRWLTYDGEKFKSVLDALMNYSDGYYISIPESRIGTTTVIRNTEFRTRLFWLWDEETQAISSELFRIQVLKSDEFQQNNAEYTDYFKLGERDDYVYIARLGSDQNGITEQSLKERFRLF